MNQASPAADRGTEQVTKAGCYCLGQMLNWTVVSLSLWALLGEEWLVLEDVCPVPTPQ